MDEQRFVVSDVLWRRLEGHLPGKISDCGVTAKDNRLFLEAVFWRVRTGSPWRGLPAAFGNWNSQFSGGSGVGPRPAFSRVSSKR